MCLGQRAVADSGRVLARRLSSLFVYFMHGFGTGQRAEPSGRRKEVIFVQ